MLSEKLNRLSPQLEAEILEIMIPQYNPNCFEPISVSFRGSKNRDSSVLKTCFLKAIVSFSMFSNLKSPVSLIIYCL